MQRLGGKQSLSDITGAIDAVALTEEALARILQQLKRLGEGDMLTEERDDENAYALQPPHTEGVLRRNTVCHCLSLGTMSSPFSHECPPCL